MAVVCFGGTSTRREMDQVLAGSQMSIMAEAWLRRMVERNGFATGAVNGYPFDQKHLGKDLTSFLEALLQVQAALVALEEDTAAEWEAFQAYANDPSEEGLTDYDQAHWRREEHRRNLLLWRLREAGMMWCALGKWASGGHETVQSADNQNYVMRLPNGAPPISGGPCIIYSACSECRFLWMERPSDGYDSFEVVLDDDRPPRLVRAADEFEMELGELYVVRVLDPDEVSDELAAEWNIPPQLRIVRAQGARPELYCGDVVYRGR